MGNMKRLIRYATIALALLAATACEYDEGTTPRPDKLGKTIWDIAYPDLQRVDEIFDFVANYNYYLTIDDEVEGDTEDTTVDISQSERYRIEELNNPVDITIEGNTHTLTYDTIYGTTYSITFVMYEDRWEVTRTGGNSFSLTIRHAKENVYDVVANTIYNSESTGYGEFRVQLLYQDDGTPDIEFTGTLVMIDHESSISHPLTITTKIVSGLEFHNTEYGGQRIPIKGMMYITAHDALYNTTDEVTASIIANYNGYGVNIKCLDNSKGYYF